MNVGNLSHTSSGEELVLGVFPLWDCSERSWESLSDLAGAGVFLGQERKDILVKNPTKADVSFPQTALEEQRCPNERSG